SWVSERAAAAVLSLAIPTEHAAVEITVDDATGPYSGYQVRAHSGDHQLALQAHAEAHTDYAPFTSQAEAVHFLTHRLNGFAAGAHPKSGLSVIRVAHEPMHPLPARVSMASADQWTAAGILTPAEVTQPRLAFIQPEMQFDMNLPEKIG
ncbi:MAG: hypothetical protein ACRD1L_00320, partial [Terriglobales bacterium]